MCTFLLWMAVTALSKLTGGGEIYLNVFHLAEALNYATLDSTDPCGNQNSEFFDILWLFPSPDGKYHLWMRDEKVLCRVLVEAIGFVLHPTGRHVFRAGHRQRPAGLAVNVC